MISITKYTRFQKSKHLILILCFVFLASFVVAQKGVVNNGAKLTIDNGAVMKISGSGGNYTNTTFGGTHGRIVLDGKIELMGNWTNNASSGNVLINPNSTGIIIFNGASLQYISGTAASLFESLTLNNSLGISLLADAEVLNNLTLTNGLVTLNGSDLIIGTSGNITGTFGASRMILINGAGTLVKSIGSSGAFTFPIGENTGTIEYTPVDFNLITHGGLSSAYVSAHVTDNKFPDNTSPSEYLTRYWTLSSSGITNPNYNVDFNYLQGDVIGTEANVYAAEYNGLNRTVYTSVDDVNNKLSFTGLSNFANYTGVDGIVPTVVISTGISDPTNLDPIACTATFSEEVTGFDFTDISIVNGSTNGITTSNNIVYNFNVAPEGDGEIKIDIAQGVCTDIAENDNSAAAQFSIEYDGTNPTVSIISTEPNPTNTNIDFTVVFSEVVNDFISDDLIITNGSVTSFIESVTQPGKVWDVIVTPSGEDLVKVNINENIATDNAGNGNTAASEFVRLYDISAPIATLTADGVTSPTNLTSFTLTLEFNEGINGFDLADLVESNCFIGNWTEVIEDTLFTVVVTHNVDGILTVTLPAGSVADYANNPTTSDFEYSITYDGTSPTAIISCGESNPTNAYPIPYSITFSETVTGFTFDDLNITNGSTSEVLTSDNKIFTFNVVPDKDTIIKIDLAENLCEDLAGNLNVIADQFTIEYDGTSPTVTITSTEPNPTNTSIEFMVTFSEIVNNFTSDDITVGNSGTVASFVESTTYPGKVWNVSVNPGGEGDVTINIDANVANDNANNGNIAATEFMRKYDSVSPTVVLSTTGITNPTNEENFVLTVEFNEGVVGLTTSDFTASNCNLTNVVNTNDTIWTVTVQPTNTDVSVSLGANKVTDFALNGNLASNVYSVTYDGVSPDVTISSGETGPTNSTSFIINIQFTESVIGFTVDDIDLSLNCNKSTFAGSGANYTLELLPLSDGEITVDISSGKVTDAAGNYNNPADTYSIMYDGANPLISTLNPGDGDSDIALSTNLEINFNEIVFAGTGNITLYDSNTDTIVEAFDVTSQISGSGTSTIVVNPTDDLTSLTNYYIQIDASAIDDQAGNSFDGISDKITWNFTSIDATYPQISTLSPTDNLTNVLISSNLVITFNESVQVNTGNITIYDYNTDTIYEEINITSGQVSVNGAEVTINPAIDFKGETSYYVLIDNNAIQDLTFNPFAGISSKNQWNFTTQDISNPIVLNYSPIDGAQNVPVSSDLQLTFNENVIAGAGDITIMNATKASQHDLIGAGAVTINSKVVTISTADFDSENDYYVQIDGDAFRDASNNYYAGIADQITWNFTIEDNIAPTVSISTGASNPTNLSSFVVTIEFSEAVQNLELVDVDVENGLASNLTTTDNISYSVSIAPQGNGLVSIQIPAGVADDGSGNVNSASNIISLVYDGTNPTVDIASNLSGTINTSYDVTITFSEEVNGFIRSKLDTTNCTISNFTETIPKEVWTATITAIADGGFSVQVLADKVTDNAGNGNLVSNLVSLIYDGTGPIASLLYPEDNSTNIPIEDNLQITFDEVVNVNSGFINLYKTGDILVEPINVSSVSGDGTNKITIDPTSNLEGETGYYVLIDAGAFTDVVGNSYLGINTNDVWNFTTIDISSPTVLVSTVESNPTNSNPVIFTIEFSEEVQNFFESDISVSNGTIVNFTTLDDIEFTIGVSPDEDGDISILVPAGAAQDLSGNASVISNQVTLEYDGTKPTVNLSTISSGTINSSFDITISFDEEVSGFTSSNITVSNGTIPNFVEQTTNTVWIATITPTSDGTVTVDVFAGEAMDFAGNLNEASNQISLEYDGSGPEIDNVYPVDQATGVFVDENLVITFNEVVLTNTGNINVFKVGGTLVEQISVTAVSGNGTNAITINPSLNFESVTEYYVLIDAGAFTDVVGNEFIGIISDTYWTFTSADNIKPVIEELNPLDGTVDVAVNANLVVTFSENIVQNTGFITIMNVTDDQLHESIDINSAQVSINQNVLTINPSVNFNVNTEYYVLIDQSSLLDESGNTFDGVVSPTYWNFTSEDNVDPIAVNFTPTDGEIDVLNSSNLIIEFSEDMAKGTGNITIVNSTTTSNHEVIDVASSQVTIANSYVTIDPTLDLESESDYYVLIEATVFDDLAGNSYAGITDIEYWNFKTGDSDLPDIISLSPLDDAQNVGVADNLVITFNENIQKGSGNIIITNSTASNIHESIDVNSAQVSISGSEVTINPTTNFNGESDYNVLIDVTAFDDLAGNSFAGITDPTVWNFTTEDISAPTVVITSEVSGTITGNFTVTITFSEAVSGFISDDLSITNANIVSFTEKTNNLVWDVVLEPIADGVVTIDIAAGVAQDSYGNTNLAASQFSIVYDSGVGIESISSFDLTIFSDIDEVVIKFTSVNDYHFEKGRIEIYNTIGQKIVDEEINDFKEFRTKVEHSSQIYIVNVIIDGKTITEHVYVE